MADQRTQSVLLTSDPVTSSYWTNRSAWYTISSLVTILNGLYFLRLNGTLSFKVKVSCCSYSSCSNTNTDLTRRELSDSYQLQMNQEQRDWSHQWNLLTQHVSLVFRLTRNISHPLNCGRRCFYISLASLRSNRFAVNWSFLHVDQPETVTRETWKMKTAWSFSHWGIKLFWKVTKLLWINCKPHRG